MVKADLSRDYYADLELPPTADVNDIKKQFRKLALKYHPDRNPGRENEVNAKFQTIQSAHEVLTSPEQKTKYDAHRTRTSRYPTGNPYQNVSSKYPPPPKPPNMASRTPSSSGADRYASFDFMRAARKPAQEDPGSRYKAWESMRPSARAQPTASATSAKTPGTSGASANPAPTKPKPPPRTAFQRQKADASFGARKSGFAPKSPGGDEPSVPSSNYASSTRMHTNMFNDMSANARRARRASSNAGPADMFRDSFLDPRQSTPYQTRGGEKLNPFDGTNLGRAKSTRESPRGKDGDTNATANSHRRSSSAPGDPDEFPRPAGQRAAPGTSTQSTKTQFGGRPQPRNPGDAAGAPTGTARNASETNANSSSSTNGGSAQAAGTGYARSGFSSAFRSASFIYPPYGNSRAFEHSERGPGFGDLDGTQWDTLPPEAESGFAQRGPSGAQEGSRSTLNAFETKQFRVLYDIIEKSSPLVANMRPSPSVREYRGQSSRLDDNADGHEPSFSFAVPETPPPSTYARDAHRFMRNSAESINTRFVAEEHSNSQWQFSAGGPTGESPTPSGRRSQSSNRVGRSPAKGHQQPTGRPVADQGNGSGSGTSNGFDADQWATKIGSEHFVPQPPPPSVSPSRPMRPTKKPRAVLKTAGTAGLVNDQDTSSGEDKTRPASSAENLNGDMDSPNAMDIDPPVDSAAAPGMAGARNIPVEPSRPDWRAGDANGGKPDAVPHPAEGPTAFGTNNAAGSEDNDGFRTSFADFKHVAPFADAAGGLGSLGDLKSNLPFESKASARVPIQKPAKKGSIKFPKAPSAPRPPVALAVPGLTAGAAAWSSYVQEFEQYMQKWTEFNGLYVDHFAARRSEIEKQRRTTGGGGFPWLSTRGESGIREYMGWLEQDREIRAKWDEAAIGHEKQVRDFMTYRERMMK